VGLAGEARPGVEQQLHRGRRGARRLVRAQPVGIAETGLGAGDIVDVLGGERQPCQRAAARALRFDVGMAAERADLIAVEYGTHVY
jgi:hypothetical protein